jgi:hypothetical protein
VVPEFINILHTLRTKLGIKDSERHMVLKYCGDMHRYIQAEIEFRDISSLGVTYRYVIKIKQNLKQKTQQFGHGNSPKKNPGKGGPNPQKKEQSKEEQPQDNHSKPQARKDTEKTKKDIGKWCDFHKCP